MDSFSYHILKNTYKTACINSKKAYKFICENCDDVFVALSCKKLWHQRKFFIKVYGNINKYHLKDDN